MKHSWLLTLVAILAIVVFHNALVPVKANLAALITLAGFEQPELIKQNGREALIAKIYSTYPLNNHSVITVAAGSADGVAVGMAVTADGEHLLGQVVEVYEHSSNVRTIFDKNWQLSVRIGDKEDEALLVSGHQPRLTMIDAKAEIVESAKVISASRDFPYGIKLGSITGLAKDEASFQQGILSVPYSLNTLKEIAIFLR